MMRYITLPEMSVNVPANRHFHDPWQSGTKASSKRLSSHREAFDLNIESAVCCQIQYCLKTAVSNGLAAPFFLHLAQATSVNLY